MENFEAYRQSVRRGIIAAGGDPIMVEDFPSLSISPRTACLDAVASSDIYLVVVGNRGGWLAPSGKLVVEEEYEEALKYKLRMMAFIESIDRDVEAEKLVAKLSDYISGLFRTTFSGVDELRKLVEKALTLVVKNYEETLGADVTLINEKLKDSFRIGSEAVLRIIFAPERSGQLIDPVALESSDLYTSLMEIGHSSKIGLFSYDYGKTKEVGINEIVITQDDSAGHREPVSVIRLELTSNGILIMDTNVTGRVHRGDRYDLLNSMVIAEEDIVSELKKIFSFTLALFEQFDPYSRYDRLLYNVALSNLSNRKLEANPQLRESYQMAMRSEEIVSAFNEPRLITRADLQTPNRELEAIITLFRRRLRD